MGCSGSSILPCCNELIPSSLGVTGAPLSRLAVRQHDIRHGKYAGYVLYGQLNFSELCPVNQK